MKTSLQLEKKAERSATVVLPGERLQRKVAGCAHLGVGNSQVPSAVREVLCSPGRPLDAATRALMEPRFGHDFSRVKVHADSQAAASTRVLHALAYTAGQHVVLGTREPRVLAHELAHVIQQERGNGLAATGFGAGRQSAAEAEAERAASLFADGGNAHGIVEVANGIQLQGGGGEGAGAGSLGPAQLVLDGVFRDLGGQATGYTIHACNDGTVIERPGSGPYYPGRNARILGGALPDPQTARIWVHETVVQQGGVSRSWGSRLNLRQVVAHEIGHALEGSPSCVAASNRGAALQGLTAAERLGLRQDAAQIARVEGSRRAAPVAEPTEPKPAAPVASRTRAQRVMGGGAAGAALIGVVAEMLERMAVYDEIRGRIDLHRNEVFRELGGKGTLVMDKAGRQMTVYKPPTDEALSRWLEQNIRTKSDFDRWWSRAGRFVFVVRNQQFILPLGRDKATGLPVSSSVTDIFYNLQERIGMLK